MKINHKDLTQLAVETGHPPSLIIIGAYVIKYFGQLERVLYKLIIADTAIVVLSLLAYMVTPLSTVGLLLCFSTIALVTAGVSLFIETLYAFKETGRKPPEGIARLSCPDKNVSDKWDQLRHLECLIKETCKGDQ